MELEKVILHSWLFIHGESKRVPALQTSQYGRKCNQASSCVLHGMRAQDRLSVTNMDYVLKPLDH